MIEVTTGEGGGEGERRRDSCAKIQNNSNFVFVWLSGRHSGGKWCPDKLHLRTQRKEAAAGLSLKHVFSLNGLFGLPVCHALFMIKDLSKEKKKLPAPAPSYQYYFSDSFPTAPPISSSGSGVYLHTSHSLCQFFHTYCCWGKTTLKAIPCSIVCTFLAHIKLYTQFYKMPCP